MKCLSSIVTVTALLISSFTFTHAATNRIGGGTITFIGYVYEPQCAQLKYPVANKLILNVSAMVKISPKPVHLKMPKNSVLIL
ncbi:TPA: hypothetical protein ACKRT8_002409 [Providencia stuartii]|uniref:hypothetical protein n=1 Tax=Providencia stuartii TaxID=588 RepID=UPI001E2E47DE|nr:hypothetical protein [Providencia stuartii]